MSLSMPNYNAGKYNASHVTYNNLLNQFLKYFFLNFHKSRLFYTLAH